jgi:hypothetical protein
VEAVAVFAATLTTEFLPGEIFDFIPEGACFRSSCFIFCNNYQRLTGSHPVKCCIPGAISKYTVLFNAQTVLEIPGGRF